MSICPVCGFSAPTPRKLDEHMIEDHGDPQGHQINDNPSSGAFERIQASTPKQSKQSILQSRNPMDLLDQFPIRNSPYTFYDGDNSLPEEVIYSSNSNTSSLSKEGLHTSNNNLNYLNPKTDITVDNQLESSQIIKTDLFENQSDQDDSQQNLSHADSRRRYRCSLCPATFPWHGDLTEHLKFEHGVQKSRENSRGGKAGNFCCSCCKYVAKYQSELRRHMRLHWGVKPFACVFCPYRSAWKGDLKRHMESHHKECFSSEAELLKIMSQFKNNAGTASSSSKLTINESEIKQCHHQAPKARSSDTSLFEDSLVYATHSELENMNSLPIREKSYDGELSEFNEVGMKKQDLAGTYTEEVGRSVVREDINFKERELKTTSDNNGKSLTNIQTPGEVLSSSSSYNQIVEHVSYFQPSTIQGSLNNLMACPEPEISTATFNFLNHLRFPITSSIELQSPQSDCLLMPQETFRSSEYMNMNVQSQILYNSHVFQAFLKPELFANTNPELLRNQLLAHTSKHSIGGHNMDYSNIETAQSNQPLNLVCPKRTELPSSAISSEFRHEVVSNLPETSQAFNNLFSQIQRQLLINQIVTSSFNSNLPIKESTNSNTLIESQKFTCTQQISRKISEGHETKVKLLPNNQSITQKTGSKIFGLAGNSSVSANREEQWKRYQCSGCGHRSNWKWDINKHIKVAHPERTNIITITLDLEQAQLTLPAYLDRLKGLRNRPSRISSISKTVSGNETDISDPMSSVDEIQSTGEGYYRPFKCSTCGHRSNWKWDVKKHIKQMHVSFGEVITLSLEEARKTIHQYKTHRRQGQFRYSQASGRGNSLDIEGGDKMELMDAPETTKPFVSPISFISTTSAKIFSSSCNLKEDSNKFHKLYQHGEKDSKVKEDGDDKPHGFRCSYCKRIFTTWSNLHLHMVFKHSSKRFPYKRSFSQKCETTQVSKKSLQPYAILPRPEASTEFRDHKHNLETLVKLESRPKMLARRSLASSFKFEASQTSEKILDNPSRLTDSSPLQNSIIANQNQYTNSQRSTIFNSVGDYVQTEKAFELANLLEKALQLLEEVNDIVQLPVVHQSLSTSSNMPPKLEPSNISNLTDPIQLSTEENTYSTTSNLAISSESKRLVELLLQPEVQPLLHKLSTLFHKAKTETP